MNLGAYSLRPPMLWLARPESLASCRCGFPEISRGTHENNAIVLRRPIVNSLLDFQSCGSQFFYHYLLWYSVPPAILRHSFYSRQIRAGWKIDDR
jgi:hypothetical protein